jgi:two-component system C4-dicarboxylate transport sensor histidine kinase DctB
LPITPLKSDKPSEPVEAMLPDRQRPEPYLRIALPVPSTGWILHQLLPTTAAVLAGEASARAWGLLIVVPMLALIAYFIRRSSAAARLAASNAAVQHELERRIAARTVELSETNQRLQTEMDERQRAEARQRTMREDLMQANRLASLGQIAAGVAHEINQPVGAIRAYAENAQVLAERQELGLVQGNLSAISGLTERIGAITDELRSFSRKGSGAAEPTGVAAAIEGTMLLLGNRIRAQGVSLVTELPPADLRVLAQRIRLEQVLVNLVQNALEAVDGQPSAEIGIHYVADADEVRLTIDDNGPGIPPEIMARLFVPFTTGKARGLGLGLVISNDIVTEFGGRLEAINKPTGGASFTVTLRRAA